MKPNEFRDAVHLPNDANEYADDLLDILYRIPDGWGRWISCDKGWYELLAETNRKLKFLYPSYEIHQVKEKYGTLRFYWGIPSIKETVSDEEREKLAIVQKIMSDVAHAAEIQSAYVCETCGASGTTRVSGNWYKTLCYACAKEQEYPVEEWETEYWEKKNDKK